ncbi:MAG: hypothetical protein CL596_04940 [Alteromonas sp.]|nr:hypothetical protein [Alteromonas sp.]|tara:strand:- start:14291 stop:14947 length:657 start_codon:yes stop_codon:yes gene_type:complete
MDFEKIGKLDLTLAQMVKGYKENILWCINEYQELYKEIFSSRDGIKNSENFFTDLTIKNIYKHYGLSTIYLANIIESTALSIDSDLIQYVYNYGNANNLTLPSKNQGVFIVLGDYMNQIKLLKQEVFPNSGYSINSRKYKPINITQDRVDFCKIKVVDNLIFLEMFFKDLKRTENKDIHYDYLIESLLLLIYIADIINIDKEIALDETHDNQQLLFEF